MMHLVDFVLSPLGFGLLLALVLWRLRARLSRGLWRAGIAIEIVCIVLATPLGAGWLIAIEERRAPMPDACTAPKPSAVVLLAGGVRRPPRDVRDYGALSGPSVRRTIDAASLMRDLPGAQLVITGTGDDETVPESAVMAELAQQLGVGAASIRLEPTALTTWENALRVHALDPALPSRIWLVTSALHMPRALVAFHAAGFEPCGYPSDFLSKSFGGPADLLPSGSAVANSEAALHEMVGEVAYRLRAARR